MSGLTVGLLSIDKLELELKVKTGEKVEKDRVSRNSFEIWLCVDIGYKSYESSWKASLATCYLTGM